MQSLDSWKSAFQRAQEQSNRLARLRKFNSLHQGHARRAAYFCELAGIMRELGLSNAFESSALSVEPTHPVPPSQVEHQVARLTGSVDCGARHAALKLSLLSLPMLATFAPVSQAASLSKTFPWTSPLHILDPLYGFGFFIGRDGKVHNHCFAIDFWMSRLEAMPPALSSQLWKTRADSMLSGGALAGRLLFRNIVPTEPDSLKRSTVPEVLIRSEPHLLEVVAALAEGARTFSNEFSSDVQLWFRGQGADYQVPCRDQLVKRGFVPYSNIPESDLSPSLYRRYDSYLEHTEKFEMLLVELARWVNAANGLVPRNEAFTPAYDGTYVGHGMSPAGLTSFQRGLLLQQYGAPSSYLDITKDPLVAAWFATRRCTQAANGQLTFSPRTWSATAPAQWPTIFVFPLVPGAHTFLDLSSILPESAALRPQRQACGLLGGAGNLARNYCARFVGLKLRLDPQFALRKPWDVSVLFPPDTEDAALAALKDAGLASELHEYPVTEALQNF